MNTPISELPAKILQCKIFKTQGYLSLKRKTSKCLEQTQDYE
jgi:hypothetical protein